MEYDRRERDMRVTKSFRKSDLREEQKILIYGAGRYGELALHGLRTLQLEPLCFADEKMAGETFCGYEVISPIDLQYHLSDIVLVASYNYFFEMVSNLQAIGFEEIYDILELIKMEYDESVLSEYLLDEKHNWHKYANVVENIDANKLIINHCELVVTECCSLKCRDCANLMQYYEHPSNLDLEEIITSFNRFLDSIDMLLELRILGGEPFIRKDLDLIINAYVNNEKIKRITVYTNSTIVPSTEVIEALKNDKVTVHMSNYGNESRNVDKLDEVLTYSSVNHYVHNYEKWINLGGIEKRNYGNQQLIMMYRTCLMAKCYTFYRGKFYLCPRAAHGETLGIFKNSESECVDFSREIDIFETKEKIKNLINDTEYVIACNYCNGSSSRSETVEAGIQMKGIESL